MFIYAIGIREDEIRDFLNLLKFTFSPYSKNDAHITVRGPYHRQLSTKEQDRINLKIFDKPIKVAGVETFFESKQNTVFLKCESTDLKFIWNKFDFPYNPHITIYDGNDRKYALEIFNFLKKIDLSFTFHSTNILKLAIGHKKDRNSSFYHQMNPLLGHIESKQLNFNELSKNGLGEKLELIKESIPF